MRLALARSTSRVVAVGCGNYGSSELPNVRSVSTTLHDFVKALVEHCGAPRDQISMVEDPTTQAEIAGGLDAATKLATGTLVFYYVGHGLVNSRGELYLSVKNTNPVGDLALDTTALRYQTLRDAVQTSPASSKIVILDCCFSGRAISALSGQENIEELAEIEGASVWVAAARNRAALAPLDEEWTAFTGELISVLAGGVSGAGPELTVSEIYDAIKGRLKKKGRPAPRRQSSEDIGRLPLARNAAVRLKKSARSELLNDLMRPDRSARFSEGEVDVVAITVPLLENATSATVIEWLKLPGEVVNPDEEVVTLETDKATFEITARVAGRIEKLLYLPPEVVNVGDSLALVRV